MAVIHEFLSVFVRMARLEAVFPGGREALYGRIPSQGACFSLYHDGEVARYGAMNSLDVEMIIHDLQRMGLRAMQDFGGFGLPWLEMNPVAFDGVGAVALKGSRHGMLIGFHNFDDFLEGRLHSLRPRATALVFREGKVLLVRDRGVKAFSLPGGGLKVDELPLGAALRELHEETDLRAVSGERLFSCDVEGRSRRHLVSALQVPEWMEIRLGSELEEACWCSPDELPPQCMDHVMQVLQAYRAHCDDQAALAADAMSG